MCVWGVSIVVVSSEESVECLPSGIIIIIINSSVGIGTRLRAGRSRIRGSILTRRTIYSSSPSRPNRLLAT